MSNDRGGEVGSIVDYTFPKSFLDAKEIVTKLVFAVGNEPIPLFRIIEHHYINKKLYQTFDFTFGFCIPNSTNQWECTYTIKPIDKDVSIRY
jgi:protein unc-119